jgi:Flp pilus assembly protein CpaB
VVVDKGADNKDPIAKLLFQGQKVLGTGQKSEIHPGDKPQIVPTVRLEVTPAQREHLALAGRGGRIFLVVRGQEDQLLVETRGTGASALFGQPGQTVPRAIPAAAKVSPPARTAEMVRGSAWEPVTSW